MLVPHSLSGGRGGGPQAAARAARAV